MTRRGEAATKVGPPNTPKHAQKNKQWRFASFAKASPAHGNRRSLNLLFTFWRHSACLADQLLV
jgi:hypothetical protein